MNSCCLDRGSLENVTSTTRGPGRARCQILNRTSIGSLRNGMKVEVEVGEFAVAVVSIRGVLFDVLSMVEIVCVVESEKSEGQ
jgi:hypothetical protein